MPEYLSPGVYLEEVPSGNKPIEGVSTSTAAFVGVAERGPVNDPTLVTSFGDFTRRFGSYLDHRVFTDGRDQLPYAAEGFFTNGGSRLYVTRVLGSHAAFSTVDLFGSAVVGAARTSISARAAAGATTLLLNDGTNIGIGDTLLLLNGARSEYVTVQSNPISAGVRLNGRLHSDHGADDAAVQDVTVGAAVAIDSNIDMPAGAASLTAVTAGALAGLGAGDVLRISDTANAGLTEFVTITNAGAADFDEPGLLFAHPGDTTLIEQVTLANAAGEPGGRTIDTGATAGDFMIPLTGGANDVAAGQVIRIGSETYVVQNIVSSLSIAATPTESIHAAGTEVIRQQALVRVHARHAGGWGDTLRISVRPSSILQTTVSADAAVDDSPVHLGATFGLNTGSVLSVRRANADVLRQRIAAADTNENEVDFAGGVDAALQAGDAASSVEYNLLVERLNPDGKVVESEAFGNLGIDPQHNRYGPRIVGAFNRATGVPATAGESDLVRLSDLTMSDGGVDNAAAADLRLSIPFDGVSRMLDGGSDDLGTITDQTYIGTAAADPVDRTGIFTFQNIDDISIVAAPGRTSQDVQNALINHCELMRYRFAVLDSEETARMGDVQAQRQRFDTTRAALYYPWVTITDLFGRPGDVRNVSPSGAVVGIYARSDNTRGVHKAPANEVVRGVRDVRTRLTKGEQDILNPKNINCLRDFSDLNRGLRVWGARTLSSDPEWKYVNVRRLFLFVEKSIERGLQYAVFEPNSEALWATVRRSIGNFLTSVWRDGALEGTKPEEAFFVQVGLSTMTQNDIDNGRLIVVVGIAPVKPAEFVIIRIQQKTREAVS